jgi:hypothetical protein
VLFDSFLVESCHLPFFNNQGTLGAFPDTGTQAIAIGITDEPGFTIDNLQGTLGAGKLAQTAAITFFFVNFDDISFSVNRFFSHAWEFPF